MNWDHLADFILTKTCDERRRYGSCGCRSRDRKRNPCQNAARLEEGARALADGRPTDVTVEELAKFVRQRTCHNVAASSAAPVPTAPCKATTRRSNAPW